jgi:hypothetical protein
LSIAQNYPATKNKVSLIDQYGVNKATTAYKLFGITAVAAYKHLLSICRVSR